jgi:hypothetical protein
MRRRLTRLALLCGAIAAGARSVLMVAYAKENNDIEIGQYNILYNKAVVGRICWKNNVANNWNPWYAVMGNDAQNATIVKPTDAGIWGTFIMPTIRAATSTFYDLFPHFSAPEGVGVAVTNSALDTLTIDADPILNG